MLQFLPQQTKAKQNLFSSTPRISRSHIFFKMGVLNNLTIFSGKHLGWSLFLINLLEITCFSVNFATLFLEQPFYRMPPVDISARLQGLRLNFSHFIILSTPIAIGARNSNPSRVGSP